MITLIGAILISVVAVYLSRRIAIKIGAVAKLRKDRWHCSGDIPKLAGPAILLSIVPWVNLEQLVILFAFCTVGVLDDLYCLRPLAKALLLLVPSVIAGWLYGLWWVGVTCWLVANALNLLDHADGLAGVTVLVSLQFAGSQLGVAGSGACLGFMFHNFPPARVFLGDGGSLMLGAMLVLCWAPYGPIPTFFAAAVPIADASFVTLRRLREGRKPWVGGTDHTGHILLKAGVSPKILPLIYGGITAIVCSGIRWKIS